MIRDFGIKNINLFLITFFWPFISPLYLIGQDIYQTEDTLRQITIEEVVITANRYENKILNTGASIGVLDVKEINSMPAFGFSNTLQFLPGIFTSSTDGMGLNPRITLRGFYGGGEADYITLLIDGIPVNDLENGIANWNLMPIGGISKIEILRGGSSPLYGDVAMGGIVNVITGKTEKNFLSGSLGYGSFNSYNLGLNFGRKIGKGSFEIYGNNDHSDGFREHSKWNSLTLGGKIKLPINTNTTFSINLYNHFLNSDDPGVLPENFMNVDREQSLPFFKDDGKTARKHIVNMAIHSKINKTTDMDFSLSYQHKTSDQTRTYLQNPLDLTMIFENGEPVFIPNGDGYYDTTALFGDTKRKEISTNQAGLAVRILHDNPFNFLKIAGGIEVDYGDYNNDLFDHFSGYESRYRLSYMPTDTFNTQGNGYRFKAATYLNGEILLFDPLSLIAGLRYDVISDDFSSDKPWPDTTISKVNSALSPKIALNLVTGESKDYSGNIYLSYSHSFKAPTIEQLTEFKSLNNMAFIASSFGSFWQVIPIPPFSNSDLKPQKSKNFELGLQQFKKINNNLSFEISLAGYQTKVEDEIDFDLTTYQYKNLVSTNHTGLETSLKVLFKNSWSGFLNVNYCETKFTSGENNDRFLKGQPNTSYLMGIAFSQEKGFGATLMMNGAGGIWLDDENTAKLKPFTIFSTRLNYKLNFSTFYIDIDNIFDTYYSSSGYKQNGEKFLFPAVGRFIRAGVFLTL